jgi:protein phosphatase
MQDSVAVDLMSDDPELGDLYVLCSDGLSGMITDEQILSIVMSTPDLSDACRRLIEKANENGGEDNITVLVVRFVAESDELASKTGSEVVGGPHPRRS